MTQSVGQEPAPASLFGGNGKEALTMACRMWAYQQATARVFFGARLPFFRPAVSLARRTCSMWHMAIIRKVGQGGRFSPSDPFTSLNGSARLPLQDDDGPAAAPEQPPAWQTWHLNCKKSSLGGQAGGPSYRNRRRRSSVCKHLARFRDPLAL